MQSSHATIVLILAALSVGQITYENALALTIGANIGTTITAVIGSLSSNIDGKRLAGAHFIFNIMTAIIAIIFIDQIMSIVAIISDSLGISSDNHTLRLAVFDSFFKIMGVIIFIPFVNTLVNFLQKTIKSSKKNLKGLQKDTARYLNNSVLELPTTAMASIKRETNHLYENAFEIIAHGINIKRSNILSDMPIQQVVEEKYSKKKVDIDDFYNKKIKSIYGEIIDFSAKAQSSMSPDDINQLYKLKLANKDIVDAVKNTKHLQKNLVLYSNHTNKYIQEQYTSMRKDLVVLLRSINIISKTKEEEEILLLLSKAKLHAQKYDFIENGILDNLIRNSLITNEMATSLMNDSSYALGISNKLLSMAEILYNNENGDLLIDEEDVHTLLNEKDK